MIPTYTLALTLGSLGSLGTLGKEDRPQDAVIKDKTRHRLGRKIPVKAVAAVHCRTPSRSGSTTSQVQGRS